MNITHLKSALLEPNQWQQINDLNKKIIRTSLYDQKLFQGGCLASTCENGLQKAKEGSAEILLGYAQEQLVSYMIFYTQDNPSSLHTRLANYQHLGKVCYSEMLVVSPEFQRQGYSKQMRKIMKEIGKQANVDAFMAFVRVHPIPNISSLLALRAAGAVSGKNHLRMQRQLATCDHSIEDICAEMVYPVDHRQLSTDENGQIKWV